MPLARILSGREQWSNGDYVYPFFVIVDILCQQLMYVDYQEKDVTKNHHFENVSSLMYASVSWREQVTNVPKMCKENGFINPMQRKTPLWRTRMAEVGGGQGPHPNPLEFD